MSKIIRQAQVGLAVSAFALLTSHAAFAAALNFRLPARQMHFASPQIHATAPAVHLPLSNPNVARTPVLQHFNLNTSTGFAHSTNSSNGNTTPVGTRSNGGDLPRNNSGTTTITTTTNDNNGQTGSGTAHPVSGTNTAGGNIGSASVCATGYTLGANGMCQRGNGSGINLATGLSVPGPNGGDCGAPNCAKPMVPPHIQIPIVTIYYTRLQQIANNAAAAANAAEAAKTSAGEATDTAEDANQAAEDAQKAASAAQQAADMVCAEAVQLAYFADGDLTLPNVSPTNKAIDFDAMNAELGNCAQARQAQLAAQAAAAAAQLAANAATAQAQMAATAYASADKAANWAEAATTPAAAEAARKEAEAAAKDAAQDLDHANTENLTVASQAGKADQAAATATTAEQANPYANAPVNNGPVNNGPCPDPGHCSSPGSGPPSGPGGSPGSPGGGSPGGGSSGNGGSGGGSSGDLGSGGTPATGSDGG